MLMGSVVLLDRQQQHIVVLFINSVCCVMYSAGSGVKRVHVVWHEMFVCVHVCIAPFDVVC